MGNLNPIMKAALKSVLPAKLVDDTDRAVYVGVSADVLKEALEKAGVEIHDDPTDLAVTVSVGGVFEAEVCVGTMTVEDDDGCGSPSVTSNSMTGKRGRSRRVWDGTLYVTPQQLAELARAFAEYVRECCEAEIEQAIPNDD